jgi:hypothetical protein
MIGMGVGDDDGSRRDLRRFPSPILAVVQEDRPPAVADESRRVTPMTTGSRLDIASSAEEDERQAVRCVKYARGPSNTCAKSLNVRWVSQAFSLAKTLLCKGEAGSGKALEPC